MKSNLNHIRPWYCNYLFWLGVVGFIIIMWSWMDSFQYVRSLHTPDRVEGSTSIASYYSFHSRVGILGVTYESIDYSKRKITTVPNRGYSSQSIPLSSDGWADLRSKNTGPFQLPFAFYHKTDVEIETDYFYIAHWFLLLIYCLAWWAICSYQRSRRRKACLQRREMDSEEIKPEK